MLVATCGWKTNGYLTMMLHVFRSGLIKHNNRRHVVSYNCSEPFCGGVIYGSLLYTIELYGVPPRNVAKRLRIHITQCCDKTADMSHVQWFIAPSPHRFRSQIRAIRLNHETIERHISRYFVQVHRTFKCHCPCKGKHTAQI